MGVSPEKAVAQGSGLLSSTNLPDAPFPFLLLMVPPPRTPLLEDP